MAKAWFPFYLNDYLADTSLLSLEEHGAFILLMAFYWNSDANAPASAKQLHKVCRCTTSAERDAVDSVVSQFFKVEDGKLVNNRLDKELAKSAAISVSRRKAAKAKHEKSHASACASAEQVHTQSQSQSHNKHIVEEIVGILNSKTGKSFRANSEATKSHINARLSEGYTVNDFAKAIDNQCREWLGTEWEKYLRPQTLFNKEKFDGYVNNGTNKSKVAEINKFL